MTRACYALTCLLMALGGPSQAQSPTNTRAYCLGSSYLETCPFVDGYQHTYGEDLSSEQAVGRCKRDRSAWAVVCGGAGRPAAANSSDPTRRW